MGVPKNKLPYGYSGHFDFCRLWNLLERRVHNRQWQKNLGIHSNTVAKLKKMKM